MPDPQDSRVGPPSRSNLPKAGVCELQGSENMGGYSGLEMANRVLYIQHQNPQFVFLVSWLVIVYVYSVVEIEQGLTF